MELPAQAGKARGSRCRSGGKTMTRRKELRQLYGGRKPKSYRPAHNHIIHTPGFGHGLNGFRRFWIPPRLVADGLSAHADGWGIAPNGKPTTRSAGMCGGG